MSKQVIFSFSLDSVQDFDLIGELDRKKNRSSFIRRALRDVEKRKEMQEHLEGLYDAYCIAYSRLMKEMGIDEYIIPELYRFRK